MSDFDTSQWSVLARGENVMRVKNTECGFEWDVPTANLGSFCRFLDQGSLSTVQHGKCGCSTTCGSKFSREVLMKARYNAFGPQNGVVERCALLLQHSNTRARSVYETTGKIPQLRYVIGDVEICRTFYMKVMNISHHTCLKIRKATVGDPTWKFPTPQKVRAGLPGYDKSTTKTSICEAFWGYFFTSLCPSPADGVLLWPGNYSRKMVYAVDFAEWFKRTQPPCTGNCRYCCGQKETVVTKRITYVNARAFGVEQIEDDDEKRPSTVDIPVLRVDTTADSVECLAARLPCFALFCRCRHHLWYDQVKERANHFHARCVRCSNLEEICREGWRNAVQVEVYKRELELHKEEVRKWRNMEMALHSKAKHDRNVVVVSFDDTSALSLPHFTNRGLKNFPTATIDFVPWNVMNHGSGENAYFYTFKNDIKKGGNRICTFLYILLRRIKFSTVPHCQKLARHLVLMGDNYSENKCNILFAFCAFLVHLGWFDKVELFYGPVGHTHNGNDSVHNCHNNIAGNFDSITLAEFLQKFDFAWTNEEARPQAVFFDSCYDWDNYFSPHINRVGGFCATGHSDNYVRAVKFETSSSGMIEMHFKGSPTNPHWSGLETPDEKYPSSDGFVILDSYPTTTPSVLGHLGLSKYPELKKKTFAGEKMAERASSVGLEGSPQWLVDALSQGTLPTHGPTVHDIPDRAKGYGTVESVGARNRLIDLPIVRCIDQEYQEMFSLPTEAEQDRLQRLDRLSRVTTPDTVARPVHYVSKSRKRMADLISKSRIYRSTLDKGDDHDGSSSSSESEDEVAEHSVRKRSRSTEEVEEKTKFPTDSWGADFTLCKVGCFAVVNSLYDSTYGMSITKVLDSVQNNVVLVDHGRDEQRLFL